MHKTYQELGLKRRSSSFNRIILFLRAWLYQNIIYELSDKFIFQGFLLPNFNYSSELKSISEIFDASNIEMSFFYDNVDVLRSNLSLFNLPSSYQFSEEDQRWNLSKKNFPISINEKNKIFKS